MKNRDEQARRPHTRAYRETPSAPVWLAVIPMIVVGMIGLVGGHTAPSKFRADRTDSPMGPDELASTSEDLEARPEGSLIGRIPLVISKAEAAKPAVAAGAAPSTAGAIAPSAGAPTTTTTTAPGASAEQTQRYGCAAALQWLEGHSAPGFRFECPGNAMGHEAMTCVDVASVCPGERLIAIADACPAAYMNEAHNSWILTGLAPGRLDPYGYC